MSQAADEQGISKDDTIAIRPFVPDDLRALLRCVAECPEAPQWSNHEYANLASTTQSEAAKNLLLERRCWVAEANSHVVGLIVLQRLRSDAEGLSSTDVYRTECEIESVLVHVAWRRRAVASRLIAVAVDWCAQEAPSITRLEVRISNEAAMALYERAGFERAGTRLKYYSHPVEDALLMQRICLRSGA